MVKKVVPSPIKQNQDIAVLQKKLRFGQRALLITVVLLLGLLFITGNFVEKTDENCKRYNNCQEQ